MATDERSLELSGVVDALSEYFTVATGTATVVRRVRLDTFDRRLAGAGLTLEHQSSDAGEVLVLGRPGQATTALATLTAAVTGVRWPALGDALPAGQVRDAVAPVVGVRALTVTSDERRRIRRLELHNQDEKIVARVELDEPVSPSAAPARVSVHPLRGYDAQARRVQELLQELLVGFGPTPVEEVAESTTPALVPAPDADRSSSATVLIKSALTDYLTTMRANLPGLLDDVDTEFLHDYRVAVRRTRATLKLGRACLPDVMHTRWEPAFKELGDLTTPVRDLDVYELGLPEMRGWLVGADPADLDPLSVHLHGARTAARRTLLRRLRSARYEQLLTDWEKDLARMADPTDGTMSAGRLADGSISKSYRRVTRDGVAISGDSPAEDLHSLRKRCKELRYALEVFAPVLAKAPRRRAINDLKDLQDVLGRFQDSEVQRRALRGFADDMMTDGTSTKAVLAMGELIGHLDAEQDRARHEFDSAFTRFARPSSHTLMLQLGGRA